MRTATLLLLTLSTLAVGAAAATLETRLQPPRESGWLSALAFSPGGEWVAGGTAEGTSGEIRDGRPVVTETYGGEVLLWDARTGALARTLGRQGAAVSWVGFARDGRTLASASEENGTVHFWDLATGRQEHVLEG